MWRTVRRLPLCQTAQRLHLADAKAAKSISSSFQLCRPFSSDARTSTTASESTASSKLSRGDETLISLGLPKEEIQQARQEAGEELLQAAKDLISNPLMNFVKLGRKFDFIPWDELLPSHVVPTVEYLIMQAEGEMELVTSDDSPPTFENTVESFEHLTERIDLAMSIVRQLHATSGDGAWRTAYFESAPLVAAFKSKLKSDKKLYDRVQAFAKSQEGTVNEEQKTYTAKVLREMSRGGATFNSAQRDQLARIDKELARLTADFQTNIIRSSESLSIPLQRLRDVKGLSEEMRAVGMATAATRDAQGYVFDLDDPNYSNIMKHAQSRWIRELAFRKRMNVGAGDVHNNSKLITDILYLRQFKANLLGHKNWAEFVLSDRMAKDPETVRRFIFDLRDEVLPQFEKEKQDLEEFVKNYESKAALERIGNLRAWDVDYYAERMKENLFGIEEAQDLRPFFPAQLVLGRMFFLAEQLFGVRIEEVAAEKYDIDVDTFKIYDVDRKYIGTFFMDLFPRPGKRNGSWTDPAYLSGSTSDRNHLAFINANISRVANNDEDSFNYTNFDSEQWKSGKADLRVLEEKADPEDVEAANEAQRENEKHQQQQQQLQEQGEEEQELKQEEDIEEAYEKDYEEQLSQPLNDVLEEDLADDAADVAAYEISKIRKLQVDDFEELMQEVQADAEAEQAAAEAEKAAAEAEQAEPESSGEALTKEDVEELESISELDFTIDEVLEAIEILKPVISEVPPYGNLKGLAPEDVAAAKALVDAERQEAVEILKGLYEGKLLEPVSFTRSGQAREFATMEALESFNENFVFDASSNKFITAAEARTRNLEVPEEQQIAIDMLIQEVAARMHIFSQLRLLRPKVLLRAAASLPFEPSPPVEDELLEQIQQGEVEGESPEATGVNAEEGDIEAETDMENMHEDRESFNEQPEEMQAAAMSSEGEGQEDDGDYVLSEDPEEQELLMLNPKIMPREARFELVRSVVHTVKSVFATRRVVLESMLRGGGSTAEGEEKVDEDGLDADLEAVYATGRVPQWVEDIPAEQLAENPALAEIVRHLREEVAKCNDAVMSEKQAKKLLDELKSSLAEDMNESADVAEEGGALSDMQEQGTSQLLVFDPKVERVRQSILDLLMKDVDEEPEDFGHLPLSKRLRETLEKRDPFAKETAEMEEFEREDAEEEEAEKREEEAAIRKFKKAKAAAAGLEWTPEMDEPKQESTAEAAAKERKKQEEEEREQEEEVPDEWAEAAMPKVDHHQPMLLTHREVVGLYHEFGHLLQHMLSSTPYSKLGGTNVAQDFVEVASQLMENWAWDKRILKETALRWDTLEPIDDKVLDKIIATRGFRQATSTMQQLGLAEIDLALHSDYRLLADPPVDEYTRPILEKHAPTALPVKYFPLHSCIPMFGHSVGYSAGMYSHKWAESIEADIFTKFKKGGLQNPEIGAAFRDKVLSRGSTADPSLLVRNFLGREPNSKAFKARMGVVHKGN
eukprot:GILJ01006360.1.p1 GENE.GILJ01006360.1~~GILJ01006360.1.p1  ORF type:complete len:1483 (+),score=368.29 GILJ01006360.1:48-4496(+)